MAKPDRDIEDNKDGKEEHPREIPEGGEFAVDALKPHPNRGVGSLGNDAKPYRL